MKLLVIKCTSNVRGCKNFYYRIDDLVSNYFDCFDCNSCPSVRKKRRFVRFDRRRC